jgi:hypothetical protein
MVSRLATVPYSETRRLWPLNGEAQQYHVGDLLGLTETGYATIFDQRQPLRFLGLSEENVTVPPGAAPGQYRICVDRPMLLVLRIAQARPEHIGRRVFARDRQEVQFEPGPYGNLAGAVVAVLSSTEILVAPPQRSRADVSSVSILPAEGDRVLGRFALHQTIFVPNTAPMTITLPPLAVTQPGDPIRFIKTSNNSHEVTIAAANGEMIDSQPSYTLAGYPSYVTLISTGEFWLVLNSRSV